MRENFDVVIIGGGPAGSTAAAILASSGINTLVIERQKFPRYHVGESLLASCKTILEISGAYDRVLKSEFQIKHGARMKWGDDNFYLNWVKNINPDSWSWQVDRSQYDELLLSNAKDAGACVLERCNVEDVIFNACGGGYVEVVKDDNIKIKFNFKYIIDASGRESKVAKKFNLRKNNPIFKNAAMWSYWENARLPQELPTGALQVISTNDGWWWVIPLSANRYSVGYVMSEDKFSFDKKKHSSLNDFYRIKIEECPEVKWILENASQSGNVRAERDYSYTSKQFCGEGYFLCGDAACFLDPLLATGVHLAQFSALVAAATLKSIINHEITEIDGLKYYDSIYRKSYQRLLIMVSDLYSSYSGKDDYFWAAQQLSTSNDKSPLQVFSEISSGNADLRESQEQGNSVLYENIKKATNTRLSINDARGIFKDSALFKVDLSPIWEPWRDITGECTKSKEMKLVISPTPSIKYV